ncbi:MAG: polyribonucleotide nucleotidyltransferase [Candidatus Harrisonbacteria bacterium CG10_big_fil_rev_8_21_14_0_10_42_17]|uniref:Polyribonucleotide nucleotidyltransferase n=1 Tax=Candidatus Harrisonbacteria bacterium CG10_big_fil_rev_8_21_14_0_10_42_17 TaxID=1974584 RepID=A0A2M6WIW8_9BACT|nr:MAG: polyribonucleotide nucleotidyltransferase [Candidatus Harrisonbacteria bacterium CG10_big_fil_rev_8_21_14_0_10_42_17]
MDSSQSIYTTAFAGKEVSLQLSGFADQTNASVLARYGDCALLATVVMSKKDKQSSYFPLVVDYEERFYAAGKIGGSRFMRREGRASEDAVLTGRLIDRTIRPLFNHAMRRDVQVIVTVLAIDGETDVDFLALLAVSTALSTSNIPWDGPVAGVKLLKNASGIHLNPTHAQCAEDFDAILFASGKADRINMVELEGQEISEGDLTPLFEQAQKEIAKLVTWQETLVKEVGEKKAVVDLLIPSKKLAEATRSFLEGTLEKAIYVEGQKAHEDNLHALKDELFAHLKTQDFGDEDIELADHTFEEELDALFHKNLLEKNQRTDGRSLNQVRDLKGTVGLFNRNHGSALFSRGTTQSLAVTTLGSPGDKQLFDTMESSGKRRFMLHYNFPPFSVGDVRMMRGPGRREIGHGALAQKALINMLPTEDDFPYTIRVVSEILSSNGSSSMATVCAGTLSMMDAGIPLKEPVAGIAMGFVAGADDNTYKILTDIQGLEDHYGDMDFKVAGTKNGVTALQMDVKIKGVPVHVFSEILEQARIARIHILSMMESVLPTSRKELSPYAPSLLRISIPPDSIGEIIGPGGKVINGIIERTGALSIDIEDDGSVVVSGANQETAQAALKEIESILKEYEIGDIVEGTIVKILDFGAILQIDANHDGMIHVSELKEGFVKSVSEVLKEGDSVQAKVIGNERGKLSLSIKQRNSDTVTPSRRPPRRPHHH